MDNSFFAYLQQLELMAFFSGYPLLYAVILFIAGNQPAKNKFKRKIYSLLPFAYALTGTLYLGLQLKNLYPDYSIENIHLAIQQPYLVCWGLLSILFWVPVLAKKPVLSLLHSLVFFFFIARDLVLHRFQSSVDKTMVRNDMKIYTDSILLNMGTLIVVVSIALVISWFRKMKARST